MLERAQTLTDRIDWNRLEDRTTSDRQLIAQYMVSEAQGIHRGQDTRRSMNLRHARLYFNRDLSSIYEAGTATSIYDGGVYLTLNVTQSCADTLLAKMSRARPRVQFLTEKGNYSLRRSAKQLTQLLDGVFHQNDVYNGDAREAFRDSLLFGSGVVHTYVTDEGEACIDRVLPDELLIDETAALYGLKSLRDLYRHRYQHKDAVADKWLPLIKDKDERKHAEETIRGALGSRGPSEYGNYMRGRDCMIPVYQGWHLPNGKGEGGRYVVAVEGALLYSAPWKRQRFPFDWFHWNRAGVGIWGRSLAEQLVPIQLKLNDLLETIDAGQRLNCVPRIYVQDGLVNEELISNLIAGIIPVKGNPSTIVQEVTGKGASPEMYQEVETWYKRAYEITGVSALSATAEKPEGISSAVALRELLDREDMRFSPVGQQYERFFVDIGASVIDAIDEFQQDDKKRKFVVQVPGDKFVEKIDWASVNLKKTQYVMKPSPTSTLPTTPAGKREYAIELYQAGGITRAQFLEMLELPDTTASVSLLTAALECVERDIENILDHGVYRSPEPLGDPQLTYDFALMAYLRARNEDVQEDRLDAMRRYIDEARENLGQKQEQPAQAAAQPPQAPVMPGAPAPMLPPQPPGPPGGMPADPMAMDPSAAPPVLAAPAVEPPIPVAA